ncbi:MULTISPECIES: ferredoxin [unclassified Streptomyces]|uniref:ferredoxin n=1 Tax=unclassified Streptomyces TaxID=2593676 RepID=UPI002E153F51|nr:MULTISPECIES: ferredoxin [unclassified Streptomyces]WSR28930.1 ferredoxin [Streptomyces sp. NBC_01205]
MLQVIIDKDVCVACGACVLSGPDVFDQNEDGQAVLVVDEPGESLRDQILESIEACPVQALSLVEHAAAAAE